MDQDREQVRLAELYASMNDGELEALGEDWESLTDAARQALKAEMTRRGMILDVEEGPSREEEDSKLADPVTVAEFSEMGEAMLARGLLASGGIRSAFGGSGNQPLDPDYLDSPSGSGFAHIPGVNAGIKLQVSAADAEAAREVLERPLQDDPESE